VIRNRRTPIVAILGPASTTQEMVLALATAGVDVFRLNSSHGSNDTHAANHTRARPAEAMVETRKLTENAAGLAGQIVTQHTSNFINTGYIL